jgi:hypothetical protein
VGETDLQLGGGYTYQWECAILLALNYFDQPVRYNPILDDLIHSFLGEIEAVQLEGEDQARGKDLEDINLLTGERLILIQVKTKEAEGERWTLTDPLLLKALFRFYKRHSSAGQPEQARYVFLTNRPFNPDLVAIQKAITAGKLAECAEADRLQRNLDRYAREREAPAVDLACFREMLSQTALVEYLSVEEVKANIQVKLQAYGRRDWVQAHTILFEHFARQSTHTGGGQVTRASLFELLGKRPAFPPDTGAAAGHLAPRDRKMEILLKRVRADWVQDFLEKREAIHAQMTNGSSLFLIRKRWAPELLAQPPAAPGEIAPVEMENGAAGEAVPPEASLLSIFEQAGSLLILGDPGSGKTILLLELARLLAARAEASPSCPVPVVLNLASWAARRKTLAKWILDELNSTQYGVPRRACQKWLDEDQISLLLDGLDEIPEDLRDDCVRAINAFVEQHGLAEIAVTCRTEEYTALADRLSLRRAIRLEALSPDQVQAYFDGAGPALQALRQSLEADTPLQELSTNPLMLYILSATYENDTGQAAPAGGQAAPAGAADNQAAWRTSLFGKYVKSMLRRKADRRAPFDEAQSMHWLSWLARCMDRHNLALYSLDQMQPSWLPSESWARAYLFASRLAVGLVGGLLGSILVGLGLRQDYGLQRALGVGLVEGLLGGLVAGLMMGLVDWAWILINRRQKPSGRQSSLWPPVLRFVTVFLVVFVGVSLAFALLAWFTGRIGWLYAGLQLGVLFGLCASLMFAFSARGARTGLADDIQTVERLSWTTHAAWRGALWGGVAGAFGGVLMGFFFGCHNPLVYPLCRRGFTSGDLFFGIFLLTGIFAALIGFIFSGLGGTFLKIEKASPTQGIRISLANALQIGGAVGLLFAAMGALVAWLVGSSLEDALTYGLYGLFIGVLAGLYYGGLFALQYAILGLLLWISGCFPRPWKRIQFLDFAAQRIFLQRVGGAYRFFHRYLQDYFIQENL